MLKIMPNGISVDLKLVTIVSYSYSNSDGYCVKIYKDKIGKDNAIVIMRTKDEDEALEFIKELTIKINKYKYGIEESKKTYKLTNNDENLTYYVQADLLEIGKVLKKHCSLFKDGCKPEGEFRCIECNNFVVNVVENRGFNISEFEEAVKKMKVRGNPPYR